MLTVCRPGFNPSLALMEPKLHKSDWPLADGIPAFLGGQSCGVWVACTSATAVKLRMGFHLR